MEISRRAFATMLAGVSSVAGIAPSRAQTYPANPVKVVVPFPPGNFSDLVGRLLADEMRARHGATAIVENRPGATGAIGVQTVTQAQPDGYTLLMSSNSPLTVNSAVRKNIPFDILKDLEPISLLGWTGYLIVVPPNFPASTLAEAIKLWRDSPGKYTAANPGVGTAGHLATERLARALGTRFEHASYRGSGQALLDLNQDRAHLMIDAMTSSLPQVRGGMVKPLAVVSPRRSVLIPEVPSLVEAGVPELAGIDLISWTGLLAPAKTSKEVVDYWNGKINQMLGDKKFVERMFSINVEAAPPGPAKNLHDLMEKELARWRDVASEAGISLAN